MKLNDIRRLAVRQKVRVRFGLSNGMECVIDEHGISRIPSLNSPLEVSLEDELVQAGQFTMETAVTGTGRSGGAKVRTLARPDLEAMAAAGAGGPVHHDHDE